MARRQFDPTDRDSLITVTYDAVTQCLASMPDQPDDIVLHDHVDVEAVYETVTSSEFAWVQFRVEEVTVNVNSNGTVLATWQKSFPLH